MGKWRHLPSPVTAEAVDLSLEPDTGPSAHLPSAVGLEPDADQSRVKLLQRSRVLPSRFHVSRPVCKQVDGPLPQVAGTRLDLAFLLEPLAEQVLLLEVVRGRAPHARPAAQARSPASRGSPRSSSAGCPATRPSASPRAAGRAAAGLRVNGTMLKRRRAASSTLRRTRLVIADDRQLELRLKVKKSCRMKRAVIGSPPVSLLDAAFGPGAALLGLGGGDQPRAAQHGEIGRVPVALGGGEGVHRPPWWHSRPGCPSAR